MNDPLPNYLRSFRQKAGLTQDEVGFLLGGVHGTTITRHEEYQRKPSLEAALGYSALFRLDPREIFAGRYATASRALLQRVEQMLAESTKASRRSAYLLSLLRESGTYLVPCEADEC